MGKILENRRHEDSDATKNRRAYKEYIEIYRDKRRAEDYYQSSNPQSFMWFLNRRNFLGWLVANLEVRAVRSLLSRCNGHLVLDAPCGSGKLTPTLTGMYQSVIGMDTSREMMSKISSINSEGLMLVEADIRALPLADHSVDIAICNRFLHRIPPEIYSQILKELHRVSRRYAILYFNVRGMLTGLVMLLERILHLGYRGKVYYLSRRDIREELSSYGWDFLKSRSVMPLGISTGYLVVIEKRMIATDVEGR